VRAWIVYSALRVGVFLLLFALLFALTNSIGLQPAWLIAAAVAALLALCISYIFFHRLRERVALELAAARTASPRPGNDEQAEDGAGGR
jgi:Na+/melibiose symporter-like transporter